MTKQSQISKDEVIPLRLFDGHFFAQSVIVSCAFLVEGVLDASKLQSSLEGLAEQPGWRKLGARLKRKDRWRLEYHIPTKYTEERPAIRFRHIKYDMHRSDHPIGSLIPSATTKGAEVVADADKIKSLWHHVDMPTKFSHYLERDEPQLGLIVVSFSDSTLVTLNWPHTLFDGLGQSALINAWTMHLRGESTKVPSLADESHDPLKDIGRDSTKRYELENWQLSVMSLIFYFFRVMFNLLFSKQENHVLCLPAAYFQQLHRKTDTELSTSSEPNSFISDGDILCAWWARANVSHFPKDSNKLANLSNGLSWRAQLKDDLLPSERPYLSNAVSSVNALIPIKEILNGSLAEVALKVRHSIVTLGSREQIEAYVALWRNSAISAPPVFGNTAMHMICYSNWTKMKVYEIDFSAALMQQPQLSSLPTPTGKLSYVQPCFGPFPPPNTVIIVGKDQDGNFWLNGTTSKQHWKSIKNSIEMCQEI